VDEQSGTWHYGLIARWWAEFNKAEPEELEYYKAAIRRFGEQALDLGCGTGRFLVPLLAEGLDVDGVDVSPDMIAAVRGALPASRRSPQLFTQALHELHLNRTYRTVYMCGVFGLGGRRDRDLEALLRVHQLLEPGGALLIIHQLPYDAEEGWPEWLPGSRPDYPMPWPEEGNRKRTADGGELELLVRVAEFSPLEQQLVMGMRARLWREGSVVKEESYTLKSCLYFAQEIVWMLKDVASAMLQSRATTPASRQPAATRTSSSWRRDSQRVVPASLETDDSTSLSRCAGAIHF
jgi:SAM-dependent methyltransferase